MNREPTTTVSPDIAADSAKYMDAAASLAKTFSTEKGTSAGAAPVPPLPELEAPAAPPLLESEAPAAPPLPESDPRAAGLGLHLGIAASAPKNGRAADNPHTEQRFSMRLHPVPLSPARRKVRFAGSAPWTASSASMMPSSSSPETTAPMATRTAGAAIPFAATRRRARSLSSAAVASSTAAPTRALASLDGSSRTRQTRERWFIAGRENVAIRWCGASSSARRRSRPSCLSHFKGGAAVRRGASARRPPCAARESTALSRSRHGRRGALR